jgi:hypothetical protein
MGREGMMSATVTMMMMTVGWAVDWMEMYLVMMIDSHDVPNLTL